MKKIILSIFVLCSFISNAQVCGVNSADTAIAHIITPYSSYSDVTRAFDTLNASIVWQCDSIGGAGSNLYATPYYVDSVAAASAGDTSKLMTNYNYAQFNVRNFGAVGDGVTNDEAAIQAAINAAFKNGGGWVVIPHGWRCNCTGPWHKMAGGDSCLLYMPNYYPYKLTDGHNVVFIGFKGDVPQSISLNDSVWQGFTDSTSAIISTDTNTDGVREIIGSGYAASDHEYFTAIKIGFEDISIVFPHQSNIGGANCRWDLGFYGNNSKFIDDSGYYCSQPNPMQEALVLPANNNWAEVDLTNTFIGGAYIGLDASEHAFIDRVKIFTCYVGFLPNVCGHDIHVGTMLIQHCPYSVNVWHHVWPGIDGGTLSYSCPIKIENIDIERDTLHGWRDRVYLFDDSSNVGKGEIDWYQTPEPEYTLYKYGCTGLRFRGIPNGAIANWVLNDGTQASGKMLTATDASGHFDWQTYTGSTSVTTLGTITAGTWNGSIVGISYGGTNNSSYTSGRTIYYDGTKFSSSNIVQATNGVLSTVASFQPDTLVLPKYSTAITPLYGGQFWYNRTSTDTTLVLAVKSTGTEKTDTLNAGSWKNYTPTTSGWAASPTITEAKYTLMFKTLLVDIEITGTSNSSTCSFTLPPPFVAKSTETGLNLGSATDGGTTGNNCGWNSTAGSATLTVLKGNNAT
ncbi:MAG TPA: glycosyl hydrolase family 28-related protein, partial [Candidatus Babeliaceae bacterium]|nr:glycosyl hydrolase family 28-related protein [Candidatus Babeliaceae bacterium]